MAQHANSYAREECLKLLYSYAISGKILETDDNKAVIYFEDLKPHIADLDLAIKKHLQKRSIEQLNVVVISILRLGAFEILIEKKHNFKIIINESVNLGKKYSDDKSAKFINAILNNLYFEDQKK